MFRTATITTNLLDHLPENEKLTMLKELNKKIMLMTDSSNQLENDDNTENSLWVNLYRQDFGPITVKNAVDAKKLEANAKTQYIIAYLFLRAKNNKRPDISQIEFRGLYLALMPYKDQPWATFYIGILNAECNGTSWPNPKYPTEAFDYGFKLLFESFKAGIHQAGLALAKLYLWFEHDSYAKEDPNFKESISSNALYAYEEGNTAAILIMAKCDSYWNYFDTEKLRAQLQSAIEAKLPGAIEAFLNQHRLSIADYRDILQEKDLDIKLETIRSTKQNIANLKNLFADNIEYQTELDFQYAFLMLYFDSQKPIPLLTDLSNKKHAQATEILADCLYEREENKKYILSLYKLSMSFGNILEDKYLKCLNELPNEVIDINYFKELYFAGINSMHVGAVIFAHLSKSKEFYFDAKAMFWCQVLATAGVAEAGRLFLKYPLISSYGHLARCVIHTFGARHKRKLVIDKNLVASQFNAAMKLDPSAMDIYLEAGRAEGLLVPQVRDLFTSLLAQYKLKNAMYDSTITYRRLP